jgi:hypothetical protein
MGFLSLEPREPELRLLHRWLDSWSGIGHIAAGMARQEYDLELRRYDGQGWRATSAARSLVLSAPGPGRDDPGAGDQFEPCVP